MRTRAIELVAACLALSACASGSAVEGSGTQPGTIDAASATAIPLTNTTLPPTTAVASPTTTDATTTTEPPTTIATTTEPPTTTTEPPTTTTIVAGKQALRTVIDKCDVPRYIVHGDQIVFESIVIDRPQEQNDKIWAALFCVRNDVLSPAGAAILGSASGVTGPVSTTEDGLIYTQIYNKLDYTDILTVQVEG